MKIVYRKRINERIRDAIWEAKKANKKIEEIQLSLGEYLELEKNVGITNHTHEPSVGDYIHFFGTKCVHRDIE